MEMYVTVSLAPNVAIGGESEERITGSEEEEWYALNKRKLATIRAAQRECWRAAGGARELLRQ